MIRFLLLVFLFLMVSGCENKTNIEVKALKVYNRKPHARLHITAIEQSCINNGLVDVAKMDSSFRVKIIYSSDSNVMHFDAYGDFDKAYLQREVCEKLIKANKLLKKFHPSYTLIIYDAARPLSVQQRLWDSVKMPKKNKINFVADPTRGSLHNYGCAVDLSIIDQNGRLLDMGTKYDCPEKHAYPIYEEKFFEEGKLSKAQVENRKLLRTIMKSAGFSPTKTEWWHFNATSLQKAKVRYLVIP